MSVDISLQNDVLLLSKGVYSLERQMHLKCTCLKTNFTTKILFARVTYYLFRLAKTGPDAVCSKDGAPVSHVMKVCCVEAQMKGK